MTIDLIAYLAGMLTTIAFIPQVWRVWRVQNIQGVSFNMYIIFVLGTLLWVVYGYVKDIYSIAIFNGLKFILVIPIICRLVRRA